MNVFQFNVECCMYPMQEVNDVKQKDGEAKSPSLPSPHQVSTNAPFFEFI